MRDKKLIFIALGIVLLVGVLRACGDLELTQNNSVTTPSTSTYGGIFDTISNGYLAIKLWGVRTVDHIGIWRPEYGHVFLIIDLKVEALRDGQYVSIFFAKIIQSDGRVHNVSPGATSALSHPFEDATLNAGQWTDGEIAFEVDPGRAYYILEYDGIGGNPIRFKFSL